MNNKKQAKKLARHKRIAIARNRWNQSKAKRAGLDFAQRKAVPHANN